MVKNKRITQIKDPFYNSMWITKLTLKLMREGKRALITKFILRSFITVKKNRKQLAVYIIIGAMRRIQPILDTVRRRKAKKYLYIPIPIPLRRQLIKSLTWIVLAIKTRFTKSIEEKITEELNMAGENKKTAADIKSQTSSRQLYDNRTNIYYRWK